jgi:hypothetical protein
MLQGVYKQNSASSKYVASGQGNVAACAEAVAAGKEYVARCLEIKFSLIKTCCSRTRKCCCLFRTCCSPMSLGAGEVKLILFCQSLTLILAARAGKKVFKRVRIHSVQ